jgi:copper(I)-binding protein
MSFSFRLAGLVLAILLAAPLVQARDYTHGNLKIGHPWARETPRMARAGGAFLVIENAGDTPDRLLKASSPAASRTEVHSVTMDGNVMRMREVEAIEVAAKSKVELKPGGYHIMLMELKAPLKAGDTFPLTLTFEQAGDVTVEIMVEKMTGPPAGHGGMKH